MGYQSWVAIIVCLCAVVLLVGWRRVHRAEVRRLTLRYKRARSSERTAIKQLAHWVEEQESKEQEAPDEVQRLKELTDHLSEAIGIMQKSRDQWKDMFFVQAREHGNGQALLERALTRNRDIVRKLVASVNAVRKQEGKDPITKVEQLDDPPIGTAEAYRAAMKELGEQAPPDPDMVAERDRLLDEARSDDDGAKPSQPEAD
jgi:hypothetical protein